MSKNEEPLEQNELLGDFIEQKQKYRKIIQAAITKWIRDFQDGKIQIKTVDDLRTLMQVDVDLQKAIRLDLTMRGHKSNVRKEGGK